MMLLNGADFKVRIIFIVGKIINRYGILFIRRTNEYIGNIYNILLLTPLADKFNLCLPFGGDLPEDTANFMTSIVGIFKGAAQFNSLNPMNIKNVCETMENEEVGTPLDRLSKLNAR